MGSVVPSEAVMPPKLGLASRGERVVVKSAPMSESSKRGMSSVLLVNSIKMGECVVLEYREDDRCEGVERMMYGK